MDIRRNRRTVKAVAPPPPPPPGTWMRSQSGCLKLELRAKYFTPLAVYSSGAPFVSAQTGRAHDRPKWVLFLFFWVMQLYFCLFSFWRGVLGGEEEYKLHIKLCRCVEMGVSKPIWLCCLVCIQERG